MSPRVKEILSDALTLPLDERAQLAAELLASMDADDEDDAGAEEAWAASHLKSTARERG